MTARRCAVAALVLAAALEPTPAPGQRPEFMLVVHGGAGTIRRADLTPQDDSAYRATLTQAIRAGYDVLRADGSALDAIIARSRCSRTRRSSTRANIRLP